MSRPFVFPSQYGNNNDLTTGRPTLPPLGRYESFQSNTPSFDSSSSSSKESENLKWRRKSSSFCFLLTTSNAGRSRTISCRGGRGVLSDGRESSHFSAASTEGKARAYCCVVPFVVQCPHFSTHPPPHQHVQGHPPPLPFTRADAPLSPPPRKGKDNQVSSRRAIPCSSRPLHLEETASGRARSPRRCEELEEEPRNKVSHLACDQRTGGGGEPRGGRRREGRIVSRAQEEGSGCREEVDAH